MPSVRTLIFAKAPLAGQVKTRLAQAICAGAAAALYRQLIAHCVDSVLAANVGEAVLCVTPAVTSGTFLSSLARQHGLRMLPQQGGDIGARMAHALRWSLADGAPTLLIGSDCAALTPDYLHAAAAALAAPHDAGGQDSHEAGPKSLPDVVEQSLHEVGPNSLPDVVLGPAEDGGYFLIGARERCPDAFAGIEWSTARVLEQTRAHLRRAGLRWHELAPIWDVDEPKDLARLQQVAAFQLWHEQHEQNAIIASNKPE
jgi:uncharacterized protein